MLKLNKAKLFNFKSLLDRITLIKKRGLIVGKNTEKNERF